MEHDEDDIWLHDVWHDFFNPKPHQNGPFAILPRPPQGDEVEWVPVASSARRQVIKGTFDAKEQTGIRVVGSLPSFMLGDMAFEPLRFVLALPKEPNQ